MHFKVNMPFYGVRYGGISGNVISLNPDGFNYSSLFFEIMAIYDPKSEVRH